MERIRIFEKIKGELDDEMQKVKQVKDAMQANQSNLHKDREAELKHWKDLKLKEEEDRKKKFEEEKFKANQLRQINDLTNRLNMERQKRAREVLRELAVRGVKTIGKDKIQVMEQ